jgi:hypothetical protein
VALSSFADTKVGVNRVDYESTTKTFTAVFTVLSDSGSLTARGYVHLNMSDKPATQLAKVQLGSGLYYYKFSFSDQVGWLQGANGNQVLWSISLFNGGILPLLFYPGPNSWNTETTVIGDLGLDAQTACNDNGAIPVALTAVSGSEGLSDLKIEPYKTMAYQITGEYYDKNGQILGSLNLIDNQDGSSGNSMTLDGKDGFVNCWGVPNGANLRVGCGVWVEFRGHDTEKAEGHEGGGSHLAF